jgi:hypothetical protein
VTANPRISVSAYQRTGTPASVTSHQRISTSAFLASQLSASAQLASRLSASAQLATRLSIVHCASARLASRILASCIARQRDLHRASVQLALRISACNIAHQRVMYRASAHCALRMAHGAWRMAHGAWRMAHGAWRIHAFWHCVSAHLATRSSACAGIDHRSSTSHISESRIANRAPTHYPSQRVLYCASANCALRIASGAWCAAHGAWRMARGAWHIAHRAPLPFALRVSASGIVRPCIGASHTSVVRRHRPSEPRITHQRLEQREPRTTRCSSQSLLYRE